MKLAHFGLIGALAVVGAAHSQQPPDVVASDGYFNTAMGTQALEYLTPSTCQPGDATSGCYNTAVGYQALVGNTTGIDNTASGAEALESNFTGDYNSAFGAAALISNTTGNANTATGWSALFSNQTGINNTATGATALQTNLQGNNNTAAGVNALYDNVSGSYNTATGVSTLYSNTIGGGGTATGASALASNLSGNNNTASGYEAVYSNTTGSNNTGSGTVALYYNTTGSNNIAVGYQAGFNLTTGSNNIDIGNMGVAGETHTIRIGTHGTQKATFIAGIYGSSVSGSAVMVSAAGKLGVTVSSERFKTAIASMTSNSARLGQLRPVTFHLKTDPKGALQYGLIAEEVARVYPELVIRDETGRIDGVRYDELAPMLLNEVQQQQQKIAAQDQRSAAQEARIDQLTEQWAEMHAALDKLQSKDDLVAKR